MPRPRPSWIRGLASGGATAAVAGTAAVAAVVLLACLTAGGVLHAAADELVDAKRSAALKLLREGKTAEGVALLLEVVKVQDTNYADFAALARAYDKLGRTAEAVQSWRKVQQLTSDSSKLPAERSARQEADRRLRALDALNNKVDALVDRWVKELDALDREAEQTKNEEALERLWSLRAGVLRAAGSPDRTAMLVLSTPPNWQDTGFKVIKGHRYRITARGRWKMGPNPADECTAAGLTGLPPNQYGPIGMLQGAIIDPARKAPPLMFKVGELLEFEAPVSGTLGLGRNEDLAAGVDNSGALRVLIERL